MSVYQLSYDVKDSEKTDNNEFRKKLVKSILVKLKPSWFHRPVASTLFFCCKYDMSIVKAQIAQLMVDEAFYILTEAKINSEDKVVMSWVKDPELEKSFKRECDQIQNKDKC